MNDAFVDLEYRGLPLGKRVKLAQVRPSTGYVELPTPMPVGTAIAINADDGVVLDAKVEAIFEQVGGSDRVPGMLIKPALDSDAAKKWWKERVTLPELEPPAPPQIKKRELVHPKRKDDATVTELMDDGRNTSVMDAPTTADEVPAAILAEAAAEAEAEVALRGRVHRDTTPASAIQMRTTMPMPAVMPAVQDDEGKKTIAMDAVDLRALGLEPTTGQIPVVAADDEASEPNETEGGDDDKKPEHKGAGARRRRKKR